MKTRVATTLCCLLMLSACDRTPAPEIVTKQDIATNPRYQIVFGRHMRADTFLIDTETGRIWQKVQFTGHRGQPEAWEPMLILDHPDKDIGISYETFMTLYPQIKPGK